MSTYWDWISVILFAILAIIFLQRSIGPAKQGDHVVDYLPPAAAFALANWLGNEGQPYIASFTLLLGSVYMWFRIKPLSL